MYIKIIILVFITSCWHTATAQTEKLNQYNSDGEKHGKWVNMLDEKWKHVEDSSDAVFYRYTYYADGTNLYPMGPCGKRNYIFEFPGSTIRKNGLILLDGEYKWYDGKNRLRYYHVFEDGEYVTVKEYFKNGQVQQHFDYTFDCEGSEHGWVVHIYKKDGTKKGAFPYCPVNGKWPTTRQ